MPKYYYPFIEGQKVLVRSNEDDPTMIATFKYWEVHPKSGSKIPVVEDAQGKLWFCMSMVVPYDETLLKWLNSFTNKDAYEWLADQHRGITPCWKCAVVHTAGKNLPECDL